MYFHAVKRSHLNLHLCRSQTFAPALPSCRHRRSRPRPVRIGEIQIMCRNYNISSGFGNIMQNLESKVIG
ncbi:hypothetical protein L2E82_26530 [Cichorium intybus]|uniref:Uncharacterized protein n=1 Tax=Cichorium intybus TaxID=13427 RepID=A0ACB9CQT2_CICIN|nr:hypothetical protein L2E82_26530 [Cichorium intybus]